MSSVKIPLGKDVCTAAVERLEWVFNTFGRVCLSFSGGKDSTVMFHLAARTARKLRKKFCVLFIDWEAQFSATIEHVQKLKNEYTDVTEMFYWVALPLTTPNAVSQIQPEWICWENGVEWIREPPGYAITEHDFFPFYEQAMTFERFIVDFSEWFSGGNTAAILVGIRADESFQRFMSIASQRKMRFSQDKPWTTASSTGFAWNVYPIYDWKVCDIWAWFSRNEGIYNPLYDLMYKAGVSLKDMRICEPFGPEQRQGLWLYHALEPERWQVLCERVAGANCGRMYANRTGEFYARRCLMKPDGHTWRSYAMFLLDSMPRTTAEHYRNKIAIYLNWCLTHDFPTGIPDEQDNDTGSKDIPSWRRICKTLLKNDFWCRSLSFSPTKPSHYHRYCQRIQARRNQWKLL
ncbi:phosphoadenosine phosphosulfate reductase [Citrobacter koseri]|uniref:phosphoadenosine phosphosulfate reductase n=1 Tax=Citrobacter koseri TaxID=545 RepID=UPI0028BD2587|nr:DUF3440 domain-containing protein [Citrobacter koseri]MDT7487301.1 DUF3440 domain-containing protein [Citrobacter koseri]